MKRKIMGAVLMLSVAAGAIAGCGNTVGAPEADNGSEVSQSDNSSQESGNAERVVLNYYAWSEGDYLQEIVDIYNAQSTLAEVKMTQVNSSDYDDKLLTMLSGKNDIDVFNMRSGSLLTSLASTGNLADISGYIAESDVDVSVFGTAFAETKVEDRFYALPYRASAFGLFYNKKIFDDKGISYPEELTWEEYAELAARLTFEEDGKKFYGGYIPDWSRCPYPVLQAGSNLTDDDLVPLKDWAALLDRLYNKDNSHMSYMDMKSTGTDAVNFFSNGGCAMYPGGEWTISDVRTMLANNPQLSEVFELGIAAVPQIGRDENKTTIGGVSTFAGINAQSKKQEAAFDFIKFLSGREAALTIAGAGAIPAYIDDEVAAEFEEVIGIDGAGNMLNLNKVPENLFIPEYTQIADIYMEELELYLIGEQSLEDLAANFAQRRAEIK